MHSLWLVMEQILYEVYYDDGVVKSPCDKYDLLPRADTTNKYKNVVPGEIRNNILIQLIIYM